MKQTPLDDSGWRFDPHHPHDSRVKFILCVGANMADPLSTYLPRALAELIEWKDLRIEPGSFLGPELKATYSDILVSVPLREGELRIYFLIEHKSREDDETMAQLLELLTKVTLQLRKQNPKSLKGFAPVVALTLHHGEEPWSSSLRMADHYHLPEPCKAAISRLLIGFESLLLDLRTIPMESIHNIPPVRALLKALKAVKEGLEGPQGKRI